MSLWSRISAWFTSDGLFEVVGEWVGSDHQTLPRRVGIRGEEVWITTDRCYVSVDDEHLLVWG